MFTNNIDAIIAEYIAVTEEASILAKRVKELKTMIFEHAGNSLFFETDSYAVTITEKPSCTLDTKALYADFPDIKKTYGKTTVSKSIVPAVKQEQKTA